MTDTAMGLSCVGGYVFSCFVAASIAKEIFGVSDGEEGPPPWAMCGVFWPLVVAFWLCVGVWRAMWWLANTPVRVIANERRRRRAALAEVERILAAPVPTPDGAAVPTHRAGHE